MTPLVNIRCRDLSLTISREQCGAQVTRRHAAAVCRSCPVGMAHARGEAPTCWPDGARVEEVVHMVVAVAPPKVSHKRKIPTFADLGAKRRRAPNSSGRNQFSRGVA